MPKAKPSRYHSNPGWGHGANPAEEGGKGQREAGWKQGPWRTVAAEKGEMGTAGEGGREKEGEEVGLALSCPEILLRPSIALLRVHL